MAGLAVALAQLGWAGVGALALLLAAVAAAGGMGYEIWRQGQRLSDPEWLPALLAQDLAPELGSATTSAVDLARKLADPQVGFSRPLAEAHLERTALALDQLHLTARLHARQRKQRRWHGMALAAAALWAVGMTLALDAGRTRLKSLIVDPRAARLSDVPLAGDIHLTYRFPEYTGLPPRIVEGGDGSIQAVAGTEVELKAVADTPVRKAFLRMEGMAGDEHQDVPMTVSGGRSIAAHLPVLRDGRYHFVLVDEDGDLLEDRQSHPIRALMDEFPEIHLDDPAADVELRDNQSVNLRWRAKDDFGISEVSLVVERDGQAEPTKIVLPTEGDKREGAYRWSVAELHLEVGKEVRFHLEAADNDAIAGPKRSVSVSRKLTLFSARQHHEELHAKQQEALDALVDWLGAELTAPFGPGSGKDLTAIHAQEALVARSGEVGAQLKSLIDAMRGDKLTKPEVIAAFVNIADHVDTSHDERRQAVALLAKSGADGVPARSLHVATVQAKVVKQLEKDIIYLDDLIAVARIDELKLTAKDLLTAQHDLQSLLQQYKDSQDPALRAQLQERIRDMRQRMLDLMEKMSAIKKTLPAEYRNMESASMLKLDDQMNRLEKDLKEGDLESAGKELEQLANMLENMVSNINNAEDEFGGDRYKEMREQLGEFANKFKELENEQQAVSQRSDELLKSYRKKAIERAGNNLEQFVQKARGETRKALQELDQVASHDDVAKLFDRDLDASRQSLLDLDALLEHRDFAEARTVAQNAEVNGESLQSRLQNGADRYPGLSHGELGQAAKSSARAAEHTREVATMLDKLFPDASQVLNSEQMQQMQRLGKKQQSLEQQAQELQNKMEQMSGELPLFGGEPRENLNGARGEMEQAARDVQSGELPGGAGHSRRALEQLGKLREALEHASRGHGKGLPLPLGMGQGQGQNGSQWGDNTPEEVQIPKSDRNRASPRFRQDLMEAAKQKPPTHFEEAVRRYYEELIR